MIKRLLSAVTLLVLSAGIASGQANLIQTTLATSQGTGSDGLRSGLAVPPFNPVQLNLTSVTGILPAVNGQPVTYVFIGGELEGILSLVAGQTNVYTVLRGQQGTKASYHQAGDMVLAQVTTPTSTGGFQGSAGFQAADPPYNSACVAANTNGTPWLNVLTSYQWLCSASGGGPPTGSQFGATLASYGILAAAGITNTGATVVTGGVCGSFPTTTITFDGGTCTVDNTDAAQAQAQLRALYLFYSSLTPTSTGNSVMGGTKGPGVYNASSGMDITTNLILSGPGLYVFQAGSTITLETGLSVTCVAGCLPQNVYWTVGSSFTSISPSTMLGNILAFTSITLGGQGGGADMIGRALAGASCPSACTGAVTIAAKNNITVPSQAGSIGNSSGAASAFGVWTPGWNNPYQPQFAESMTVVTAASALLPSGPLFEVTGSTAITSFLIPVGFNATAFGGGQFCMVPEAAFTTVAGNNIAFSSTAVIGRLLCETWDATTLKFVASY